MDAAGPRSRRRVEWPQGGRGGADGEPELFRHRTGVGAAARRPYPRGAAQQGEPRCQRPAGGATTFGEHAADVLAAKVGSWTFILNFLAVLGLWIAINTVPPRTYVPRDRRPGHRQRPSLDRSRPACRSPSWGGEARHQNPAACGRTVAVRVSAGGRFRPVDGSPTRVVSRWILMPNAVVRSTGGLSPRSDDPSSCQLSQCLRCVRRVCPFQDVPSARP